MRFYYPSGWLTVRCPVLLILAPESVSEYVPSYSASWLPSHTGLAPFTLMLQSSPGLPVTFHTTPDTAGHVTPLISDIDTNR